MPVPSPLVKLPLAASVAVAAALGLAACGSAVSTSGFTGEQRAVAQTIANLQADATAANEQKVCANDLAASAVSRLGGAKRCEAAIKKQLGEIDSLEVSVQSVQIAQGGKEATAQVKSTYSGKSRKSAMTLVKEGSAWKVSATS